MTILDQHEVVLVEDGVCIPGVPIWTIVQKEAGLTARLHNCWNFAGYSMKSLLVSFSPVPIRVIEKSAPPVPLVSADTIVFPFDSCQTTV
jgi:hypothetical protein